MKAIWMCFIAVLAVKVAIAIAERPRPMFDALHESGEAREASERTRLDVAFFADAVKRVRRVAIVWMAKVWGGRNGVATGYLPLESGHGRGVQERRGRSPKRTICNRMSI